jgi:hypothetical protein
MRRLVGLILCSFLLSTIATAVRAETSVVTRTSPIRVWVDQIGYSIASPKVAIVASDSPLPDSLAVELHDAKTNRTVWKSAASSLAKFNSGKKDGESGEYLAHLDFSDVRKPGRYYFVWEAPVPLRSYMFNIAERPFHDSGLAAWKAYYYSRAEGEKSPKYAGPWSYGPAFLGPNQSTEAKVYKWKVGNRWPDQVGTELVDSKTYDVHGGWWDAGDFNKYTSNSTSTHNQLLMAYEMSKGGPKDKELNIPESGNGFPDVLDEIRCETEFLLRDTDGTGAAFGRVHLEPGSPPDTVKKPVQLTIANSEVTMGRACALAYAAVVWRESGLDKKFADACASEALKSWNLLKEKPHPWPVDPKNSKKIMSQGEMRGDSDYPVWRLTAAAALFRLTGKAEYDEVVRDELGKRDWGRGEPAEPALWIYLNTRGADPALGARIRKELFNYADGLVNQSRSRGYGIAMQGYWWGSNRLVGKNGGALVLSAMLTDDAAKRTAYMQLAEEYLHYLNGRNPLGLCYFTNMKSYGAENSVMVLFHSWVGNVNSKEGQKYIGEGPGKIGPFPGYVIGGPNGNIKRLVEDLDWRKAPWEFTEPDIAYQSEVMRMYGAFIWPR